MKMRFDRKSMFLVLFLCVIVFLVSCKPSDRSIELIYVTDGDTVIENETVKLGDPLSYPIQPTKEGYIFSGWYLDDQSFTIPYTTDYDLANVSGKTLSIYAKWMLYQYTITLNTNGGSNLPPIHRTIEQSSMIEPNNPTKAGYHFIGWYLNSGLTDSYAFDYVLNEDVTLYAKWGINGYTLTFDSNGGTDVSPIEYTVEQQVINQPENPTKEGYTFMGWYLDIDFIDSFEFDQAIHEDVTIYARWEAEEELNTHLLTDTLPIFSSYYGNTNGNLNNLGLAVYDTKRALHYFSSGPTIYQYNPSLDETNVLATLTSGGRATYLNLDSDLLYFIDSSNGYLVSYHLVNHVFDSISETENTYASRTQSWVNIIYPTIMYDQPYIAFQRYITSNQTLSSIQGYGYEHMNINGTRVYYKPINSLSLNVMSYNGSGKSTIVNLASLNVTEQYESLLYHVGQDYISYFALVLEIGEESGVYLYNSTEGLVKIMSSGASLAHSLNYDGRYLYVISGSMLYKIDPETKSSEAFYAISSSDSYLNIINHWLYIGSFGGSTLYRINPSTNEIESVFGE